MHVRITDYNEKWPQMFAEEALAISGILDGNLAAIYHIGSTAVPGLAAKPIIDIMPVVCDLKKVDKVRKKFVELGYEYMGEFGIPGRRYMRKGGDDRTHQVHIFERSDRENIVRHLAVRDYLIAHPQEAESYAALKRRLAALYPEDIGAYCDGKDAFVKALEEEALKWYSVPGDNG